LLVYLVKFIGSIIAISYLKARKNCHDLVTERKRCKSKAHLLRDRLDFTGYKWITTQEV